MKILAIDLGKFNSVACLFDTTTTVQPLGNVSLSTDVWRPKDTEDNSHCCGGPKTLGALLGNVKAQAVLAG